MSPNLPPRMPLLQVLFFYQKRLSLSSSEFWFSTSIGNLVFSGCIIGYDNYELRSDVYSKPGVWLCSRGYIKFCHLFFWVYIEWLRNFFTFLVLCCVVQTHYTLVPCVRRVISSNDFHGPFSFLLILVIRPVGDNLCGQLQYKYAIFVLLPAQTKQFKCDDGKESWDVIMSE
ncbi:hypothetical protein RJT34_19516 [Clitoria ternatea]|uniref:Uncharacterized protein n=1 Tax=Clitoria ternatea TaxID=43366 RepID=A0AAN9P3L1_CLITE